jgi:hypothetical protein
MKELELQLEKLKEAIELKDPYLQIDAIGNLGLQLKIISLELGHDFNKAVNNSIDELK